MRPPFVRVCTSFDARTDLGQQIAGRRRRAGRQRRAFPNLRRTAGQLADERAIPAQRRRIARQEVALILDRRVEVTASIVMECSLCEVPMFRLKHGDVVCDLDKDPESGTNRGKVEEILPNGHVRVLWENGRTNDRSMRKLGKITAHGWIFAIPPSVRKDMKNKLLQMTDEEIDAEIARQIGSSTGTDD